MSLSKLLRVRRPSALAALISTLYACGNSSPARPLNSSPNPTAQGTGGALSASGGTSSVSSGGSGGRAQTPTSGGVIGLGGGASASGGTPNFASGGVSPMGGNPSSGAAAALGGATNTGGGGASSSGSALDGFRIEIPCIDHFETNACHTLPADAVISRTLTFGGTPGTTYEVTLRVRGLVEAKPITGGTGDSWFVVGGTANDNAHETALKLSVASPAQHYFFNKHEVMGDVLYKVDYMAKIKVEGGSSITFTANDIVPAGDQGDIASNWNLQVVEGIPPAPLPFDGQFVQFNVVSVNPPL